MRVGVLVVGVAVGETVGVASKTETVTGEES